MTPAFSYPGTQHDWLYEGEYEYEHPQAKCNMLTV
jgi:hypothetical protein